MPTRPALIGHGFSRQSWEFCQSARRMHPPHGPHMRLALFVLCAAVTPWQNTPPRDRVVTAIANGTVRGTVTAAASGNPLHRVQITLVGSAQSPRPAVTNTRGEYEIAGVPPGTYTVIARRSGYLALSYGEHRIGERGRPITVSPGEITNRINFKMVRGATLAGTVTDEVGTEYAGVRVEAVEFKYVRGRRIPVQAAAATTNDLGQFRLSGLPPGAYLLRASAADTWTSDDGAMGHAYIPTYYPGAIALGESETLTLGTSQEIVGLNFGLRVGRSARISGVFQAAGAPAAGAQAISLSLITRTIGNAVQSSAAAGSARTDSTGAFEFRNLAPGEYVVSTGSEADRASVTLILAEGDERSVTLGPQPPIALSGTVHIDQNQPAPFAPTRLRVTTVAADPDYLPPNSFITGTTTDVTRDWTFRYTNLVGPYVFRLEGLPDDWLLARVTANGREVTDTPVEIGPGRDAAGPVQITISGRGAAVSGQVTNADGEAAPDATVIVFAADPARWSIASRYIKVARPQADGRFTIAGLPPAAYRVIARESIVDGQWEDPGFLNTLMESAQSFEGRAGETATLTLSLPPAK